MGDVTQAATLLDFSKPMDVTLLDATVNLSMQSVVGGEQQVGTKLCHQEGSQDLHIEFNAEDCCGEALAGVSGAPAGLDAC